MLDGITILNQTTQWNPPDITLLFIVAGIVAFVVTLAFAISDCEVAAFISGIIALGCLIGVGICATTHLPEKAYQQYQVTISDEVNFKEFSDKYNIIEQEGQIYTIAEKTANK